MEEQAWIRPWLTCGSTAALMLLVTMPAWPADEGAIEEIVVTGSYIRRGTEDSPSPLTVVDRIAIEQMGAIEVTDVIDRMTFNSGSTNVTNAFSGGDNNTGQTNVNLRNLGLGSTLVLLDGKRSVPGSSDANANTFVSLTTLVPSIAIERFEVVKDGASALYGSDAIAGVVNVITREDFEGLELSLDYRADQETGDQDDNTIGAIWGVQGERGGLVISAEYLDRDGLQIKDRFNDFGRSGISTLGQPGTTFVAGSAPGVDPNVARALATGHLVGGGVATGLGGAIAGDLDCEVVNALDPNSFRSPLTGQVPGDSLNDFGGCLYDFSSFFNIVGEEERFLLHATGSLALSDEHEAYGSFRFSDQEFTRGNSLFPLVRFPAVPRGNPGLENDLARRQAALDLLPDDTILAGPTEAFPGIVTAGEVDLLSQVGAATFFGRVLGGGPDTPFALRPEDTDTREFTDEFRVVTGLRGDLAFGSNWTYDAAFTFSQRQNQARNTDTRQQQLVQALNGFGGPQCDSVSGVPGSGNLGTGDCFYFNPFGSALVKPDGALQDDPLLVNPPELIDWMVGEIRSFTEIEQKVVDVVVTGDLIEVPFSDAPLAVAAGFQWRQDQISVDVDQDSNINNFSFIFGAQDFSGQEDTFAGFVELAIPVGNTLEIQAAGRYEYFDVLDDDTWDPKITALWTPRDDLSVRASWGTSFRVGSLLQRFGQTTQLLNIADVDFSGTALAFRPIITDGNPGLAPEDATAFNAGFSYRPSEGPLANLRVDVDYYHYDIEDLITRQGFDELIQLDVASRCPQGLNSNPNDNIPDCGLQPDGNVVTDQPGVPEVVRGDNFSLLRIENSFNNSQELESDGIDLTVGYTWFTDRFGAFSPEITGSWTNSWDLTNPQGLEIDGVGQRNFGNSIGRSLPEWKVNLSLGWNSGRHSAFLLGRYVDTYDDDQPAPSLLRATTMGIDVNDRHIASMTTWDLQYRVELPAFGPLGEGSTLSLGGINIFNREPPKVNVDGGFDPTVHDPRGAVWYGRVTFRL